MTNKSTFSSSSASPDIRWVEEGYYCWCINALIFFTESYFYFVFREVGEKVECVAVCVCVYAGRRTTTNIKSGWKSRKSSVNVEKQHKWIRMTTVLLSLVIIKPVPWLPCAVIIRTFHCLGQKWAAAANQTEMNFHCLVPLFGLHFIYICSLFCFGIVVQLAWRGTSCVHNSTGLLFAALRLSKRIAFMRMLAVIGMVKCLLLLRRS